ncbi:MAG: CDP-diacylglycerol--serine O-phosphatidyltransferase [Alphaproteobacteria bacterium]|nr:CDP-diacylglycerol--serine O-phosphatidyltransferase [Alphaproteobacteria bacterium]
MMADEASKEPDRRRFRPVPVRYLLPNLLTLLALCSGITAIRFAVENRYEIAVSAIILAIVLDAMDGRLARYLNGTSRFGAELDSLADFVNFGVAPALIMYFGALSNLKTFGWVVCLMLAIGAALRLARFNVALDDPNKPSWAAGYFTGIPAPAGALLALSPLYYQFLGLYADAHEHAKFIAGFLVVIAILMISRVPTFSGKTLTRVPREAVLPILAAMALGVLFLISFPWESLALVAALYFALIPISFLSYRKRKKAPKAV